MPSAPKRVTKGGVDTGRARACWKVDEEYLLDRPESRRGQDLYLCFTDKMRIIMTEKPIVKPVGYVEDADLSTTPLEPIDYAENPWRMTCRAPIPVRHYTPWEYAEWTRAPCFFYNPCTCHCRDPETTYVFTYPCSKDCRDGERCMSSEKISCIEVDPKRMVLKLMYPSIRRLYVAYRYIVTVGTSAAYIAPFPPSPSISAMFEGAVLEGEIPSEHYRLVLDKYGGRVPNSVLFVSNALSISERTVFPNGTPPEVPVEMGTIPIDFDTARVVGFNFYPISKHRAHFVLVLWYEKNWLAYAAARACWEMRKDIVLPVYRLIGRHLANLFDIVYPLDVPPPIAVLPSYLDAAEVERAIRWMARSSGSGESSGGAWHPNVDISDIVSSEIEFEEE